MGAVDMLARTQEFKTTQKGFGAKADGMWMDAVRFFNAHREELKAVRNSVGGHFKTHTAAAVIRDHLDDNAVGLIEQRHDGAGNVDVRLKFAVDMVTRAFVVSKPTDSATSAYVRELFGVLRQAWRHVVNVMHVLVGAYLIDRAVL